MANMMNNYFTTIGPSLAANTNDPWIYNGPLLNTVLQDTFHVEHYELLKILQDIDITKSSAIEFISSKIVKDALITLIDEFRCILNVSFTKGSFPDKWKIAQITSLPKDGDLSLCNNYRPISVLPLPGKITEKIVHARLSDYLETNNILDKKNKPTLGKVTLQLTPSLNLLMKSLLQSIALIHHYNYLYRLF